MRSGKAEIENTFEENKLPLPNEIISYMLENFFELKDLANFARTTKNHNALVKESFISFPAISDMIDVKGKTVVKFPEFKELKNLDNKIKKLEQHKKSYSYRLFASHDITDNMAMTICASILTSFALQEFLKILIKMSGATKEESQLIAEKNSGVIIFLVIMSFAALFYKGAQALEKEKLLDDELKQNPNFKPKSQQG